MRQDSRLLCNEVYFTVAHMIDGKQSGRFRVMFTRNPDGTYSGVVALIEPGENRVILDFQNMSLKPSFRWAAHYVRLAVDELKADQVTYFEKFS